MANTKTKKTSSAALSRTSIFASSTNTVRRVDTPELGGAVYVRSIRASEFNAMRAMAVSNGQVKEDEVMARLVTLAACDEKGNRTFKDADWKNINGLPLAPVLRIFRAAMKLNDISDEDIEEMAKNSPTTPNLDSG